MPRCKSAESLQDLCVEAVAANLASVSWAWLFAGPAAGDSGNELRNPFEMMRNIFQNCLSETPKVELQ